MLENAVGLLAATCTTVSYIPQLKKCWETRQAGDLSLSMFLILGAGIGLWVVYGVLMSDLVITIANCVSLTLLGGLLYFKCREIWPQERTKKSRDNIDAGAI